MLYSLYYEIKGENVVILINLKDFFLEDLIFLLINMGK